MTARPEDIERAFAAAGPWRSRFTIDGRSYGGELPYQEDGRVADFFEWVGTPASVLELGSLEGAHSAQIAAAPSVERLLCLEGRAENVRRARVAMEVLGLSQHVRVEHVDLDDADLSAFGHFDAAFCAGVLYHLDPAVAAAARVAPARRRAVPRHARQPHRPHRAGWVSRLPLPRAGPRRSVQRASGLLVLAHCRGARRDARAGRVRGRRATSLARLAERPAHPSAVRGVVAAGTGQDRGSGQPPRRSCRRRPTSTCPRSRCPGATRALLRANRALADAGRDRRPSVRRAVSLRRRRPGRTVSGVERRAPARARAWLARGRLLRSARSRRLRRGNWSASRRAPKASSGRACSCGSTGWSTRPSSTSPISRRTI